MREEIWSIQVPKCEFIMMNLHVVDVLEDFFPIGGNSAMFLKVGAIKTSLKFMLSMNNIKLMIPL